MPKIRGTQVIGSTEDLTMPCSTDAPVKIDLVRIENWRRPFEIRGWSAARTPQQMKISRQQAAQLRDLLDQALAS